jgi:hypothetical protein
MNTFHDLLTRYGTARGMRVDDREWLMLLELDPARAARVMSHLAVLAAEDTALRIAAEALDTLRAAGDRADATGSAGVRATAGIATFTERVAAARARAWHCWSEVLVPPLTDAGVLRAVTRCTGVARPPRSWTTGAVRLPDSAIVYPAWIATRRRVAGVPVIRLDADTCQCLAADLRKSRFAVPATILVDRDRPLVVLGADDLEHAWSLDAALIHADTDGCFTLSGDGWPWRPDPGPAGIEASRNGGARHSSDPARPHRRDTSPVPARGGHLRLVTP